MKDSQQGCVSDWAEAKQMLLPGERRCTVCGNGRLSSYFLHSPSYEIPICDECVNRNKSFEGMLAGVSALELVTLKQLRDNNAIWQTICDWAVVEQLIQQYSLEFLYHKFRICIKSALARLKNYCVPVSENEHLIRALLIAAALRRQAQERARRDEILRDILLEALSFEKLFEILSCALDPDGAILSRVVLTIPYGGSVDSDKKQDVWAYAESFAKQPVIAASFLTEWQAVVSGKAVKSAEIFELARESRANSLLYAYLLRISPNPGFISYRVGCIMTCLGRNGYPVVNEKDTITDNGVSKEINLWRVVGRENVNNMVCVESAERRVCSACGASLALDAFYASAVKKKNAACIKCSRHGDDLLDLIDDILLQEECKAALLALTETTDFALLSIGLERLCRTGFREVVEKLFAQSAINDEILLGWLSARLLRHNNAMIQYWAMQDRVWWRAVVNVFACAVAIALYFEDDRKRQWLAAPKHCKIFNVALIVIQTSIGQGLGQIVLERNSKQIIVKSVVSRAARPVVPESTPLAVGGNADNTLVQDVAQNKLVALSPQAVVCSGKHIVAEALQVGQGILYRISGGAPVAAKIKTLSRSKSWIELHTGIWVCLEDECFEFLDFID